MKRHGPILLALAIAFAVVPLAAQKKYQAADGKLRVALSKQPFSPNGLSKGPTTMAEGGIQKILADLGATVRIDEARLTAEEDTEYGGWKRLGMALGHFADIVTKNERDGYLHRRAAGDVSVDAGTGRRTAAFGADARAAQDRHALARCASRLQHARNDAQRIARRHAGRGCDRTRAAGHAARRQARSAARRSSCRDGRRAAHRSARADICSTTR